MVDLSAVYLNSGDRYEDKATRRDYTDIKIVLNNALNGYALKGGPIKKKTYDESYKFSHRTYFPCIKQDSRSFMESWYLIYQMRWLLKFQRRGQFVGDINKWCQRLKEPTDYVIRDEFRYIQKMIARIIICDVLEKDGEFYFGFKPPPNAEIEQRIRCSGDYWLFNSLDGGNAFP